MSTERAHIRSEREYFEPALRGRVRALSIASQALRGNRAGDPHLREVFLWESIADTPALPIIFLLPAFGARPQAWLESHPWRQGLLFAYEKGLERGELPPVKLVLVDAWTRYGGSQYVNSAATGNYEDWLLDEVLPLVRAYVGNPQAATGLAGKSSGGYGALSLAMAGRGAVHGIAAISPDGAFEHSLWPQALQAARELLAFGSDARRFLDELERDVNLADRFHATMDLLCMSACYAPSPTTALGFDLPLDLYTGQRRDEIWQRILAYDPLHRVEASKQNLLQLKYLHLECGRSDEFHLLWAARQLSNRLHQNGVAHSYAEHVGGHRGLDPRLVQAVGALARGLLNKP